MQAAVSQCRMRETRHAYELHASLEDPHRITLPVGVLGLVTQAGVVEIEKEEKHNYETFTKHDRRRSMSWNPEKARKEEFRKLRKSGEGDPELARCLSQIDLPSSGDEEKDEELTPSIYSSKSTPILFVKKTKLSSITLQCPKPKRVKRLHDFQQVNTSSIA
eukprot:292772-Amorphochlora_amoeboformis.AAC.1